MLNQVALLKHFCDTLWEYDPVKERVYIYHEILEPELCWQWVDYHSVYQEHLEKHVYWEDKNIWERYMSAEALKEFLDSPLDETEFSVRMEYKENDIQWHEAYLERYKGHVLIGSKDTKREQKNETIASAVLPEFDYVCRINIRTGGYVLYYAGDEKANVPQHEAEDYEKTIEEFNRAHVVPEEAEALTEKMRIANVVRELENAEEYVLYTEMKADGASENLYKRLRFRYADKGCQIILLTRIDVSESFHEKKKREEAEEKYRELLTNMPIAISSTEVLLDEEGKPYDFRYTYCNPAHEQLEGVEPGTLVGKEFYQFFENTDPGWL